MKKLVIDIGNTFIKAGLFEDDQLVETFTDKKDLHTLAGIIISSYGIPYSCIVSDVTGDHGRMDEFFPGTRMVTMRSGLKLPIRNLYKTPATLGTDRLANACGAWMLNPGRNSLVVDFGTCIKYDLVTNDAAYRGGSISPGLQMRYKALHKFTGRLPLLAPGDEFPALTGVSTEGAIRSGVENGMLEEINGIARRYRELFDQTDIIITGGDHTKFAGKLKSPIFVAPNLTLNGLKSILDHNDQ